MPAVSCVLRRGASGYMHVTALVLVVHCACVVVVVVVVVVWGVSIQVTACSSISCGNGRCVVGSTGPACNCTGTGHKGARCEIGGGSIPLGGGGPSALRVPLSCPGASSSGIVQCSGHGECVHSRPLCFEGDVDCTATCRCKPNAHAAAHWWREH